MIESFVKRPATTVMFVLFFTLLGMVSFFSLNIEQSPKIEMPLVVVNIIYPGATPLEIETQVLKKIEDSTAEISEIKKIESRAFDNAGYILVEFFLSADVNDKLIEVKDKVEAVLNELPEGIDRPIVQKVDPMAKAVVDLVLTSDRHNPTELYEYADTQLKNQFSKVQGVGQVDIFGGQERQIRVDLYPDLMKKHFISIDGIVAQLRSRNLTIPAGNIDRTKTSTSVRFQGEFESIQQIANLRLTTSDGNSFPLAEIAKVYDGSADQEKGARFNGKPVVSMAVKKISDGNEINVARGIVELLPEITKTLPEGMSIEMALDRSQVILRETKGTMQSVILGVFLTVIVLLFFTGNWRVTIIASLIIPSSIISSLFLVEASGFTINFITLLAIATALGTLIANAIVIIESVLDHLNKGFSPLDSAILGTKAMILPVLAACGTNLVVFTPIAFMGGIVGQFMLQFGMTVVYATLFSLLASFSLTPMLCAVLLKPGTSKKSFLVKISDRFVEFTLKEYKIIFNLIMARPWLSGALVVILFMVTFTVVPYIGNEFIPTSDQDRLQVTLTMPLGTKVEESTRTAEKVEALFNGMPEVTSVLTVLGSNGEENASVIAILKPAAQRKRSDLDIIDIITPQLAEVPNAEIEIVRGDAMNGVSGDVSINISGLDYDKMIELSKQTTELMRSTGYFRSVTSSYKTPKQEIQFFPDPVKMEKYGVTSAQIGSVFRASIYGDDTNIYREKGEEYDIMVSLDDNYITSVESLRDLFVISNTGLIPVTELGDLRIATSMPTILRRDRQRVIQLNGYLAKSTAGVVQTELKQKMDQMQFDDKTSYAFVGNAENQEESGREIGKAFLLAIIFTYMILAALMNSFIHPFTIATSIITSFSGVFLLLFFLNSSINIASMLGIVMLVGLAVNNAILILDETIVQLQKQPQLDLIKALWIGVESKFRAVLMTSIAIVFGTLPQLWATDLAKASMGAVIVGGVAASIFFTFLLIPQTFYYLEKMRRLVRKRPPTNSLPIANGVAENSLTNPATH